MSLSVPPAGLLVRPTWDGVYLLSPYQRAERLCLCRRWGFLGHTQAHRAVQGTAEDALIVVSMAASLLLGWQRPL